MSPRRRNIVLTTAALLALILAAALPLTALADDEVPSQPEDTLMVVDEPIVDTPAEVDTAPQTSPDEEPLADDTGVGNSIADQSAPDAEPAAESPNEELAVPQILEVIPENTDLVVLDEQGDVLPLVTEEAGEILVNGDPMWCPGSALPGSAGCTSSHTSFAGLLTDLQTNTATYSGAGTIYIAHDYNSTTAGDVGSVVNFDYNQLNLYGSLTLQGGWNFSTNKIAGASTIANTNLLFSDWGNIDGGTLTLNNLVFDGGFLRIEDSDEDSHTTLTQADVTLNNVTVTNFIVTEDNADNAVQSAAIGIRTTGDIVLNNVNASHNVSSLEENAAPAVFAVSTGGDVTANGGSYTNSGEAGLMIGTETGTATLNNLTAIGNEGNGVFGMGGDLLAVNGGQFNNNGIYGLLGASFGDIILNDVTATGNGMVGAILIAHDNVTVNRGYFSNNVGTGLGVNNGGNVTLNNVIATGNTKSGAGLILDDGDVNVICGEYNGLTLTWLKGGDVYLGGPVVTGSGVNIFSQDGTITYGECTKQNDNKDQGNKQGEGAPGVIPPKDNAAECSGEKKIVLQNGEAFVVYEQLCGLELHLVLLDSLPDVLPSHLTEVSGLNLQLLLGGAAQDTLPTGGRVTLKFPVPAGSDGSNLAVLFWNGSAWSEVSGGNAVDGFYTVQVQQPGGYILAAK